MRKRGRPVEEFSVVLQPAGSGKSRPHPNSMRGRIMAHLRSGSGAALISALVEEFGPSARGAVQKLREANHVRRRNLVSTPAE